MAEVSRRGNIHKCAASHCIRDEVYVEQRCLCPEYCNLVEIGTWPRHRTKIFRKCALLRPTNWYIGQSCHISKLRSSPQCRVYPQWSSSWSHRNDKPSHLQREFHPPRSIKPRKPSTQIKTRQKAELQAAQPDACLCSGQVRTSVFHLPLGSIRFKALPTLMERRSPLSSRLFWFGHVAFAEFFDHKWAELLN